jgi:hypothetical protein
MKTCARTGDKHVALFVLLTFLIYTKQEKIWSYVTLYFQTLPASQDKTALIIGEYTISFSSDCPVGGYEHFSNRSSIMQYQW